jgi:hypothetical protein
MITKRDVDVALFMVLAAACGIMIGLLLAPVCTTQAPDPEPRQGQQVTLVGEVIRDHPVVHGVIAKATGRACEEEDSVNCFWNARTMGDGRGHSFFSVRVGAHTCIVYWNERYNRHHGHCL